MQKKKKIYTKESECTENIILHPAFGLCCRSYHQKVTLFVSLGLNIEEHRPIKVFKYPYNFMSFMSDLKCLH